MNCECTTYCAEILTKFRRLPTPLLVLAVLSRFVFGVGLGATLAAPRRSSWREAGWAIMALGLLLVLPGAIKLFSED
jgi:hypothetical protein